MQEFCCPTSVGTAATAYGQMDRRAQLTYAKQYRDASSAVLEACTSDSKLLVHGGCMARDDVPIAAGRQAGRLMDVASSEELDPSVPQPPNPVSQASTDLPAGRDGAAPPPSASFRTNGGATNGGATPELPPSMYPCRAVSVTRTWSGQVTDPGSGYGALPALPSLIPPYKERERDRDYDSDEDSAAQRSSYRRRILSTPPRPGLIPLSLIHI